MRIVHVSDCYLPRLGGIERQVHDLAMRQQAQGHEVRIVTATAGSPVAHDDLATSRPGDMGEGDPTKIHYRWMASGRDVVLAHQPDVVHIHVSAYSPLAFMTAAACARGGCPGVVTLHSLWSYATPLFRAADTMVRWGRWPLAWSAVSGIAADSLQRVLGSSVPVSVLPNGVDTAAFRPTERLRPPNRIVIASVGRLSPRKRPEHLLEILLQARARIPAEVGVEAIIVGDGPQRRRLEGFIDRHGMRGWVHLVGPLDHDKVAAVYEAADVYVAPAKLESFGIAALEARCAGLPVVAFAGTGIADFVRHGVEGFLARKDREVADALVRLATDPATLDRISRHNRSTAPAVSWPGVLDVADRLYESARLLADPKRSSAAARRPLP